MPFEELITFSLATWRIASLFVREDGPFFVFRWLRERTGIQHDQDGTVFMIPETFAAGLLSCIWCSSVWIAGFWIALWFFFPDAVVLCALPFAVSGGAILLDNLID